MSVMYFKIIKQKNESNMAKNVSKRYISRIQKELFVLLCMFEFFKKK